MQRAANAYLQTQVTTTSPGNVLILLYDGAITFLNQAKANLTANDMAGKGISISKALDILNELDSALNMEKGGDLAANLHNLYFFCSSHLVMANIKKDAKRIDEVIKILNGLRNAYSEILSSPEAQAAAQTAAAAMRPTACLSPRAQAGVSPSGGSAPTPGASARIRYMHAVNRQNMTAERASPDETAKADPEHSQNTAAAPAAPPPAQMISTPQSLGDAPFMKKTGTDMYRKFAER
ncbi:MAG: flagellar export chaperone FliS [Desulfovibrio sp.]|jgi:flagellar protein FliS|nr:flagellar export chaperone FliS [Desulfovibrio sp.]